MVKAISVDSLVSISSPLRRCGYTHYYATQSGAREIVRRFSRFKSRNFLHPLWSRNSKGLESRGLQPRLVSSDCLAAKMSFLTLRRPMVCFVNVENVDRIIYSIFQRFNLEWKTRTLSVFTQAA